MNKTYILPVCAALLLAASCSKEDPFSGSGKEGRLLKSALAVDVRADAIERRNIATRAEVNLDNFTLTFVREGQSVPTAKYKYSEMPDVVTLPAGSYTVTATYGENRDAEWNNPYYLGKSEAFEVSPYEITSYIDPVVCRLENVMVSIGFDASLRSAMSADSYVEVKVGDNEGLKYTVADADASRAGYFRHTEETTLVAVFHGSVNGVPTVETKSYSNVQKGYHYRLSFALHSHSGSATGDVDADVTVDGSVTVVDVERDVPVAEDPLLPDTDRPIEGGGSGTDPVENPKPEIIPDGSIKFDVPNTLSDGDKCKFMIKSSAPGGFTALTCEIVSKELTDDVLQGLSLASNLDLVNTPADMAETLQGLGFPVNQGGRQEAEFDLTQFIPMLAMIGNGNEQKFVLTVTDAYGTTTKTLILICNN